MIEIFFGFLFISSVFGLGFCTGSLVELRKAREILGYWEVTLKVWRKESEANQTLIDSLQKEIETLKNGSNS